MTDLILQKHLEGELLGPDSPFSIDRATLRKDWEPIVQSAKELSIKDQESHRNAVGHGRLLQQSTKNLKEFYGPLKKKIDALKDYVLDAEKADKEAIETVKAEISQKIQEWKQEQKAALNIDDFSDDNGELPLPSIVQSSDVKVAGEVTRNSYSARVDSLRQLVEGVAAGRVPLEAVLPNQSWLNERASKFREGMNYLGVSVIVNTKVHFRS